jgi:hypothetical protein
MSTETIKFMFYSLKDACATYITSTIKDDMFVRRVTEDFVTKIYED